MSEPTSSGGQSALVLPVIPSGREIYDSLMSTIEPELMTAQLPLLKDKYVAETAEQKKERGKRYKKAFAAYEVAYQTYVAALHQETAQFHRNARRFVEETVRAHESDKLTGIESQLSVDDL